MTPTRRKVAAAGAHLTKLLAENEITAGIKKCGVMEVGVDIAKLEATPARWRLSGEEIPEVSEYKYFGMTFNKALGIKTLIGGTVGNAKAPVSRLTPS